MFCTLTTAAIAEVINAATHSVCYAGPGVQTLVALSLHAAARRLGTEMVTVSLDIDERVMRMGYGSIDGAALLRDAGITVQNAPGLRMGLVIADNVGYTFTPTPLYLETEPDRLAAPNAMRMTADQLAEALARLSPAAKTIAMAQARTLEEKQRIQALPVDVGGEIVSVEEFEQVRERLDQAPPVRFDLARQVRVFVAYLQYVELSLVGAAVQRHRITIPATIQHLGNSRDLEGRLRTTFDLIEKQGKYSSKPLEEALNEIRKNLTPSLGPGHGRVVLKSAKPLLRKRLDEFKEKLKKHKIVAALELRHYLDDSRRQIVEHYLPLVVANPPDALRGGTITRAISENDARLWLNEELEGVFPCVDSLVQDMKLEERYKDITYETLNQEDFLDAVKHAFPRVDWDKAYKEFAAAGERVDRQLPRAELPSSKAA